jgi:hypothetical protein
MKSILVAVLSAALVVGLYVAFGRGEGGAPGLTPDGWRPGPATAATGDVVPVPPPVASRTVEPTKPGLFGMEAKHHAKGDLGKAVKDLMMVTIGNDWRMLDRLSAAKAIHAIVSNYKPEDAEYLLEVFRQTKDPAFRWFFAALVRQLKSDVFADAVAEVYAVDPVQASETLGWVGGPRAMQRLREFADSEARLDSRGAVLGAILRSEWDGREDYFARLADDERRPDADRMLALFSLGRVGAGKQTLDYLVETALGPARPVKDLGAQASSHRVHDLRSGAVLGVMQRGDLEATRRLLEAAEAPGADPDFARMVDDHLGGYGGPDLTELIYARAGRRGVVSLHELLQIQKHLTDADRERVRSLGPYVKDAEARTLWEGLVAGK